MAVLISGKLIGPNGDPRPGVTIMLTAVKTSSAVVHLAPSSSTTGPDGSYSLSVEVGTHNVMIEAYGRPFEKVGQITVYSDSKPGTLNDFLTTPGADELTPAIVAMVDDMRAAAVASANLAKGFADDAKASSEVAQSGIDAYDDAPAAQAAINNGKEKRTYFPVWSSSSKFWTEKYKNVDGIATPTGERLPSSEFIEAVQLAAISTLPQNGIFPGISDHPLEVMSTTGKLAFGVNKKGQTLIPAGIADLVGAKVRVLPPESEYLFVIDDEAGRVAFAVGKNAFVEVLGIRIEVVDIDNLIEIVDKSGRIAAGLNRRGESLTSTPSNPIVKTEYYDFAERLHLFLFGQSLSNGALGTPILNTPTPSALMYNTGVLSRGKTPTSLVPLKESGVETMASALANSFVSHVENANGMGGRQLILNSGGVNGEMIQNLEKGTPAFNDLVNQIRWCHTYNGQEGREHAPDYVVWVHGERAAADGMSGAEYKTRVKQLRRDLEEALADSRDPNKPLMMVIYQMASHGFYVGSAEHPSVEIPLAHLALSHEDDNIMCIGPNYMFAGSDNVHKTNHGYRQMGLQVDKAIRHHILTGEKFLPLEPINFRRISDTVALGRFNVPKPPMVFDDSIVKQLPDGQNGIEAFDDDGRVPLASTEIIAGSQLKVTASRPFVGEVFIAAGYTPDNRGPIIDGRYREWFAGPVTGVRTTLRDSDPITTELTGLDGKPYQRQNYCVHFYMRVE